MTYQKIFDLKFNQEVPTYELGKRFPKHRKKISRIALLDIPFSLLRQLIKREDELEKLLSLKEWLYKRNGNQKKKNGRTVTGARQKHP